MFLYNISKVVLYIFKKKKKKIYIYIYIYIGKRKRESKRQIKIKKTTLSKKNYAMEGSMSYLGYEIQIKTMDKFTKKNKNKIKIK